MYVCYKKQNDNFNATNKKLHSNFYWDSLNISRIEVSMLDLQFIIFNKTNFYCLSAIFQNYLWKPINLCFLNNFIRLKKYWDIKMRNTSPQKKDSDQIIKVSETKAVKDQSSSINESKRPTPNQMNGNLINIIIYWAYRIKLLLILLG